jgi:hypothetical protein
LKVAVYKNLRMFKIEGHGQNCTLVIGIASLVRGVQVVTVSG